MPMKTSMPETAHQQDSIIRRNAAINRFGVSKSTFSDWQNPKSKRYRPDFPKKIQLGVNSVGYLESEINAYIAKLAENRP
ncbi:MULTISPECIES: helix-turn-helix transcriptional regulator [Rodentibacter]|nr:MULTISPECIES: AlpA family phage regulatory protein [Rodentibacter]